MSNRLPASVRATDAIHRLTVLGLVGVCVFGTAGIAFNIYANSEYASWNKNKELFDKQEYLKSRDESAKDK